MNCQIGRDSGQSESDLSKKILAWEDDQRLSSQPGLVRTFASCDAAAGRSVREVAARDWPVLAHASANDLVAADVTANSGQVLGVFSRLVCPADSIHSDLEG
jgi:hypothetical protein